MKELKINNRTPSSPPLIRPVSSSEDRPLWSVMIPTYNCSKYLEQTLRSVLQQAPSNLEMQIEVVDDASTDANIGELVARVGMGRIGFFRQPSNQGSLRNFETCINRAKGEWVHILHGDDFLEYGFYNEINQLFIQHPNAGAAYTGFWHLKDSGDRYPNQSILNEPGLITGWLTIIAEGQKIQPPAIVVKRAVYEKLGSFYGVHYGEDWEMWVRIAANYPVAHSPKQLANYRIHNNNISSKYFLSGQHIKDISFVIDAIQQYLPLNLQKELRITARKNWSHYFARTSDMVYDGYKSPAQALKQARMAFKMHINMTSLFYLLKTRFKILIKYKMKYVEKLK